MNFELRNAVIFVVSKKYLESKCDPKKCVNLINMKVQEDSWMNE